MARPRTAKETIERVTLKLPHSVAAYFRRTFPHGQRSDFVAECLKCHRREREIKHIEEELRLISRHRA